VRSDAERHGFVMTPPTSLLAGEAAEAGRQIAAELLALAERGVTLGTDRTQIAVWGGEPVVTIGAGRRGDGGRCQELALACAHSLHEAGDRARGISVLAAGTDGRDGPTDAAGAVIDHQTWARITAAGRNPARDLADHDAYPALQVGDALFITGATGTNVNDLVIAAIGGPDRPLSSAP
jgi:hydroxypyruvate reductase